MHDLVHFTRGLIFFIQFITYAIVFYIFSFTTLLLNLVIPFSCPDSTVFIDFAHSVQILVLEFARTFLFS